MTSSLFIGSRNPDMSVALDVGAQAAMTTLTYTRRRARRSGSLIRDVLVKDFALDFDGPARFPNAWASKDIAPWTHGLMRP